MNKKEKEKKHKNKADCLGTLRPMEMHSREFGRGKDGIAVVI
jgi:hypothetical protein